VFLPPLFFLLGLFDAESAYSQAVIFPEPYALRDGYPIALESFTDFSYSAKLIKSPVFKIKMFSLIRGVIIKALFPLP
jgi:hypothetical protein